MEIKPIRNDIDYKNAIKQLESIFDAKEGTDECDELEVLSILIENYENENFPIEVPNTAFICTCGKSENHRCNEDCKSVDLIEIKNTFGCVLHNEE